jgi:hypothetical protein
MHAQWEILLDEEFQDAWDHGIDIQCCDGVKRRFYPRIFTYSADYPEKSVLLFCPLFKHLIDLLFEKDPSCRHSQPGRLSLSAMPGDFGPDP